MYAATTLDFPSKQRLKNISLIPSKIQEKISLATFT